MFDFEKLDVYQKAKKFNSGIFRFSLNCKRLDFATRDQPRRASLSIMLNVAEGTGRFSKADRRHFYVIARGSAFECVAILDFLKSEKLIEQTLFEAFYRESEELSKILFFMIRNLEAAKTKMLK